MRYILFAAFLFASNVFANIPEIPDGRILDDMLTKSFQAGICDTYGELARKDPATGKRLFTEWAHSIPTTPQELLKACDKAVSSMTHYRSVIKEYGAENIVIQLKR